MKKVAIINLSKYMDVAQAPEFSSGIDLLNRNGIETVDYASGRSEPKSMVEGLHAACRDPEVGIVLTYSGGTTAINCLDLIQWDTVDGSGKVFVGLSDFTHFSWLAVMNGAECVYGLSLKDFTKYRLTDDSRQPALKFLAGEKVDSIKPELIKGEDVIQDWDRIKIIGGHTFITILMAPIVAIDMKDRVLMLEHHYNSAESLEDLQYWASALAKVFANNRPKGILLGHSMIATEDGMVAPGVVNQAFCEGLIPLGVPVYYIDHFKSFISFKPENGLL